MNVIKLRDRLTYLVESGYGEKKVGIAQVSRLCTDYVGGLDLSPDLTTILICTWDDERMIDRLADSKGD